MIIREKKYIYSKGLAFYAELEGQRLEEELAKGWLIESINWFGWYKLRPVEKEKAQIVIDFYSGDKKEVDEYLDLYEAAGWNQVMSYRNRYFVFKSDIGTPAVYSDEESFSSRLNQERRWLMWNSLYFVLASLIGFFVLNQQAVKEFLMQVKGIYYSLEVLCAVSLMAPLIVFSLLTYYKCVYLKRTSYFKEPKKFAKKQHFILDLVIAMIIGGILGGLIGFITGYFNIF